MEPTNTLCGFDSHQPRKGLQPNGKATFCKNVKEAVARPPVLSTWTIQQLATKQCRVVTDLVLATWISNCPILLEPTNNHTPNVKKKVRLLHPAPYNFLSHTLGTYKH